MRWCRRRRRRCRITRAVTTFPVPRPTTCRFRRVAVVLFLAPGVAVGKAVGVGARGRRMVVVRPVDVVRPDNHTRFVSKAIRTGTDTLLIRVVFMTRFRHSEGSVGP